MLSNFFSPWCTDFHTKLECLLDFAGYKTLKLITKSVNYGQKKFYNIGLWVYPQILDLAVKDCEGPSFFGRRDSGGEKNGFIKLRPGANIIKLFFSINYEFL